MLAANCLAGGKMFELETTILEMVCPAAESVNISVSSVRGFSNLHVFGKFGGRR